MTDWLQAWDRLWAPHRMAYIKGENTPSGPEPDGCPFCLTDRNDDLVVSRGESMFVIMNLYPYNVGHLMVVPYRHVADYTELATPEVAELGELTQRSMQVLRAVSGAQGFNIGMNQGVVAGTGIAGHLHQHVVPRWGGDTNFLPIIAGTKAMPQLLEDTRDLLARAW